MPTRTASPARTRPPVRDVAERRLARGRQR
jgi:hypothetical protein